MEQQTAEWVALYARRDSPGDPLPINIDPIPINDRTPTDAKVLEAAQKLTNGWAPGALGMHAKDVKQWLHGMWLKEDPESRTGNKNVGDNWRLFLKLAQAVWDHGDIPPQLLWVIVVLIPKGGGDYHAIGLLEPMWKVWEHMMDRQLNRIPLHESLHGCRDGRSTGTAVMEAKRAQQLAHLKQVPFYSIFLGLKTAFNSMDCKRCLLILRGYGVGQKMIWLIQNFWANAWMVCQASVNYGTLFQAGRGVTQGGPLSAKLFNVLIDTVAWEWLRELWEGSALEPDGINRLMATFFAIFYVDDAYLASRGPDFLQRALDIIVGLFDRVGLKTNVQKTQAMVCTPRRIRIHLPEDSYARMRGGMTLAGEWESWMVVCHQCNALVQASSLHSHLAEQHDTYQAVVVPEDYLEPRASVRYMVHPKHDGRIPCPVLECPG
jgi:hypothetical protein